MIHNTYDNLITSHNQKSLNCKTNSNYYNYSFSCFGSKFLGSALVIILKKCHPHHKEKNNKKSPVCLGNGDLVRKKGDRVLLEIIRSKTMCLHRIISYQQLSANCTEHFVIRYQKFVMQPQKNLIQQLVLML